MQSIGYPSRRRAPRRKALWRSASALCECVYARECIYTLVVVCMRGICNAVNLSPPATACFAGADAFPNKDYGFWHKMQRFSPLATRVIVSSVKVVFLSLYFLLFDLRSFVESFFFYRCNIDFILT